MAMFSGAYRQLCAAFTSTLKPRTFASERQITAVVRRAPSRRRPAFQSVDELTPYLHRTATRYLQRFSSSTDNLRRVLKQRVYKLHHQSAVLAVAPSPHTDLAIEQVVNACTSNGSVNDQHYTRSKVSSMHQQGKSARAIRQYLLKKGVDSKLIDECLKNHLQQTRDNLGLEDDSTNADDVIRAATYIRKRRLGHFRSAPSDELSFAARKAVQQKDIAKLMRQGFSYNVACTALQVTPASIGDAAAESSTDETVA